MEREVNFRREFDKFQSVVLPGADGRNTRLRIFGITEQSLLTSMFGLQDGDIIEFIDGDQIDFEESYQEHRQRYSHLMDKLKKGGVISLTLTRNGNPIHMEFK